MKAVKPTAFLCIAADSYLQNEMAVHGMKLWTIRDGSKDDIENLARLAGHLSAKTISRKSNIYLTVLKLLRFSRFLPKAKLSEFISIISIGSGNHKFFGGLIGWRS